MTLTWTSFPTSARADDDPWFGRDKALHFTASAAIAGGAYAIAATQFDARTPPLLIGGGVALAVGAAKEGADALGLGTPSWKDFAWDVAGTLVGLGVAWGLDLLIRGVSPEHPWLGAPHPSVGGSSGQRARLLLFTFR